MDDKRALVIVPRRHAERREHWAKVVTSWERSELSGARYAERAGVDLQSLYRWRRQLRARAEPSPSTMIEVPRPVPGSNWAAEVLTASGPVRLSMAASPSWAGQLIRELARC